MKAANKVVGANERSIDALPLNSGVHRVDGVPGLCIRCRATKTYMIQRRVRGVLIRHTLGQMTLKLAKAEAMRIWSGLKPKPATDGAATLENAFEEFLEYKPRRGKARAESTIKLHRYNFKTYLRDWSSRSLFDIGNDRPGVRALLQRVTNKHGEATANQVKRLMSAVYNLRRKVDTSLPENPMVVFETHYIEPRDWAYSPEELKAWWRCIVKVDDEDVMRGVSSLGPIKRMWWLCALFTGARKGSIEALKWNDLDFDKKVVRFTVTKGDHPYVVPMAETLAELLIRYRDSGDVPPSAWVFPSNVKDGQHIVGVKDDKQGAGPAHRLRHTFRTTLAQLGASPDQARMLMGHSMGGDVSRGYITSNLVTESLRPIVNAVATHYLKIVPEIGLSGGYGSHA